MVPGNTNPTARIAIVGVGQVGAAAAYALILGSVASELLLVDVKTEWRDAQVHDLSDVAYSINSGTRIRAATHHEAGQCDMVVITAGSKWSIGETNIQHTNRNVSIMRSVVRAMTPFRSDTIVLVVSNPVDILTSIAQELSGLSKFRVFGSGTFLDSVRLRGLLADKAEVAADSIHLSILGMHGDSQVVAWSTATINGVPIDKFFPHDTSKHADLESECKRRSESIICAKGATPFGLGSIVSNICSSVLCDKRDVRPISHFQSEFNCCFTLPAILGREGIMKTIEITLDSDEKASISRSAKRLRDTVERIQANR
ncbi:lactate/ malate dehydrogenase [Cladorrhinum sp. PSN332]|nr:lactate/ malate dehydrogenase [Cladorrhinum sp. PSN332]